jgi:hypothetical protein
MQCSRVGITVNEKNSWCPDLHEQRSTPHRGALLFRRNADVLACIFVLASEPSAIVILGGQPQAHKRTSPPRNTAAR